MGNTPSTPNLKAQNKLSKPKTYSNSTFNTPNTLHESASIETLRYADLPPDSRDPVVLSPNGELRSSPNARQQLRLELCDSRSADERDTSSDEDGLGELAVQIRDRLSNLSRSNSVASQAMTSQPPGAWPAASLLSSSNAGSRTSLTPEPGPVDLQTAISLIRELRKTASPEDLDALQKALQPQPSQPAERAPSNASSATLIGPKNTSTDPKLSIIRRRSLATPGIATRTNRSDLRRKTLQVGPIPTESDEEQANERPWKIDMLHNSSPLANVETMRKARGKTGRSMNTFSKPLPTTPRAETPGDLEYSHLGALKPGTLVITNGAASPEPNRWTRRFPQCGNAPDIKEEDYFTASEGQMSVTESDRSGDVSPILPCKERSPSPPKKDGEQHQLQQSAERQRRDSSPLKYQQSAGDFVPEEDISVGSQFQPKIPPHDASAYANDYMAEISSSPFADQVNFPSDDGRERSVASEVITPTGSERNYRDEALRMLDGTVFGMPLPSPGASADGMAAPPERPKQVKYDSGYSSGAPSMSNGNHSDHAQGPVITRITSNELVESPESITTRSFTSFTPSYNTETTVRARPLFRHTLSEQPKVPRIVLNSVQNNSRSSTTVNTVLNKEGKPVLKKLQKKRPVSYQVVVQGCKPIGKDKIPGVPDHVFSKFSRRLTMSPNIDHIEHTYPSASHADINEDMNFSSSHLTPIRFPSPTRDPLHVGRARVDEIPPPPPPHRQSLNPFRRFSRSRSRTPSAAREVEEMESFSDFSTVTHIGASPYDAAADALYDQNYGHSQSQSRQNSFTSRAKSMVNVHSLMPDGFMLGYYHDKDAAQKLPLNGPVPNYPSESRHPALRDNDHNASAHDFSNQSVTYSGQGWTHEQQLNSYTPPRTEWTTSAKILQEHRQIVSDELHEQHQHQQRPRTAEKLPAPARNPKQQQPFTFSGRSWRASAKKQQQQQHAYPSAYVTNTAAAREVDKALPSLPQIQFDRDFGLDLGDVPVFMQQRV